MTLLELIDRHATGLGFIAFFAIAFVCDAWWRRAAYRSK